jgi:uncharacterized protein YjbI with pentapeptide repeats
MKQLAGFWKNIAKGWTVQRIAAVLIVAGLAVFVFGAITQYCACVGWPNLGDVLNHMIGDFYANVSVDALSIAFAILVLDRLNEQRAEEQEKAKEQQVKAEAEAQLKAQLIREMGSRDNGVALRAINELRARQWLVDGTLRGIDLSFTDLQRADLQSADLRDTNLYRANLQSTYLRDANLRGANLDKVNLRGSNLRRSDLTNTNGLHDNQIITILLLQGAIMSDARIYNGRFNLRGDIVTAIKHNVQVDIPEAMARFYGVSLEEYLAGQEWARENLAGLRRSVGLDPATGRLAQPTNGIKPQPADAPASPAPRRNGHKASMVTHRVRR